MSEPTVRIGVVGAGAIAQIVHLPLLKQLPGARVEAVCDLDEHKAATLADRLDVDHVFETLDELLAADVVDALVICSPNHLHAQQAVTALEAGVHVLVERPLAVDAKGAEAAVKAAERADRVLVVAFNNRYRPDTRGVKSFIASGELGDIVTTHGTWFNRKTPVRRTTWRQRRDAGGGAFMDLGIQTLDLCMWLLDYPTVDRVCAHLHPGQGMEVEESAAVLLRTAAGGTISVQVTWSLVAERDRHHVRLLGTAGTATTYPLKVMRETEQGILDVTPQIAPTQENAYTASYREELRHFILAALGTVTPELPREQVELMRIVEAIYRSAEKGTEVRL
jgi:predicted dehydrogenase